VAKKTLLQLADEMDGLVVIIQLRALELTKYVTYKMLEYLVDVTPVDTSKAESNWIVALGGTSYGASPIPAYFPGSGGSTEDQSAAAALATGRATLKGAIAGKPLALVNVVPYIGRLNEGSSSQAPAGFVDRAVLVGKAATKAYNFNTRLKQDIRRGMVKADE
jgi:hypothetical protein